jgi:hypothetical protein
MSDTGTGTAPAVKTKWYEESPGVASSKRIIGAGLVGVGIIMLGVLFVACLIVHEALQNGELAAKVAIAAVVAGSSLLGLSVGTDFANAITGKSDGGGQ